ncbi:hypothetical protein Y032_0007g3307 [Ancylostoma ceylanicum]|uniref:Uncharacterized protein n=1 Tax=Ancylostoma ceylanicum TaxID=53326 RepID=A0A016VLZ1_9BILA|nr:hypothetical protein Y032_0007g3307 [Ancylostoma ceylanicum]
MQNSWSAAKTTLMQTFVEKMSVSARFAKKPREIVDIVIIQELGLCTNPCGGSLTSWLNGYPGSDEGDDAETLKL